MSPWNKPAAQQPIRSWGLWLAATLCLFALSALVFTARVHGSLRGAITPQTIALLTVAFAGYAVAVWWSERHRPPLYTVWGFGIVFRAVLLLTAPTLSDDVYRYLWDGHVAANGVSPYAYAIDAPELDPLEIPARALANNQWMASPYLPAAQAPFVTLALIFPLQPFYFQLMMVIVDIFAGVVVARLLALAALPAHRILLYLWNPLVIVEVAHGAHIEPWMILLSLLAVYSSFAPGLPQTTRKQYLAPLLLALATLTKLLPALLFLVLCWHWRWRQRAAFVLLLLALVLPFGLQAGWGLHGPLDGTGLFGATRIYAQTWRFNSGLFHWTDMLVARMATGSSGRIAGIGMALCFLALCGYIWLRAGRTRSLRPSLRLMALPFMAYVILTPTLHPWYLITVLAFLPFQAPAVDEPASRWYLVGPWMLFSWLLLFSYLSYLDPGKFQELEWVRHLQWWPLLLLLLFGLVFRRGPGKIWRRRPSVQA